MGKSSPVSGEVLNCGMCKLIEKFAPAWNVQTGREILTLTCNYGTAYYVAISSDGQMLAIASLDKTVKLWEVKTGKEICTLDHFDSVISVAFTPVGSWLAAGDVSGNIKIWRRS